MSSATPSEALSRGELRRSDLEIAGGVLDVERLRADFPILARRIGEAPLCYLDNAATTQKPRAVLAGVKHFCYSFEIGGRADARDRQAS